MKCYEYLWIKSEFHDTLTKGFYDDGELLELFLYDHILLHLCLILLNFMLFNSYTSTHHVLELRLFDEASYDGEKFYSKVCKT